MARFDVLKIITPAPKTPLPTLTAQPEAPPPYDRCGNDPVCDGIRKQETDETEATRKHTTLIVSQRPEWATAAIMADLEAVSPEAQYDNFDYIVKRSAIIGWRRGSRDCFKQLRAAAATFPETAFLATATAKAEHRDKWAWGRGYYLRDGCVSGWRVYYNKWSEKFPLCFTPNVEIRLPDYSKPVAVPSAVTPIGKVPGMTITEIWHTKRQAPVFVVRLSERVDHSTYLALLGQARKLGGWYSSYGPVEIRGFMFPDKQAAQQFAGVAEPVQMEPAEPKNQPVQDTSTVCITSNPIIQLPEPEPIIIPAVVFPASIVPDDWRLAMAGLA
ncbi:MAG: hypothetical protein WCO56_24115 [Verrucomicrobiota bacterium]